MSNIENVKIGICSVTFGTATPLDLGHTKGGVDVEVTTETYQVMVDQYGETPAKEFITGRTITVATPLAETSFENFVAVLPGATKIEDSVTPTKVKVSVTNGIGIDLLEIADKLVLHPINAGASVADDLMIPKAATPGSMSFTFQYNQERVYDVTWRGYPDQANGDVLFVLGDATAVAA